MHKFTITFIVALTSIVLASTNVFASDLDKCVGNYCSYSCKTVASCGYQAQSQVAGCTRSCKPSAKASLKRVKKSKRLKACKNNSSAFHKLTCGQIGSLLGAPGGGGGNTKRAYYLNQFGVELGSHYAK